MCSKSHFDDFVGDTSSDQTLFELLAELDQGEPSEYSTGTRPYPKFEITAFTHKPSDLVK